MVGEGGGLEKSKEGGDLIQGEDSGDEGGELDGLVDSSEKGTGE